MLADQISQCAAILVVEDDNDIRDLIAFNLGAAGFEVQTSATIYDARLALKQSDYDLLITDVRLPDGNGLEFAREIIKMSEIGIIVMTGAGDEIDRIIGLELGADDYINKPFHQRELVARARAVLRRLRQAEPQVKPPPDVFTPESIQIHGYSLFKSNRSLVNKDGRPVPLTTMEFDVLAVLAENKNTTLSRSTLYESVGCRGADTGRLIDGLISRLRKKLSEGDEPCLWIQTVHSRGYTLIE